MGKGGGLLSNRVLLWEDEKCSIDGDCDGLAQGGSTWCHKINT